MAVEGINFDTGMSQLPDIGILEYNGVQFSSLFYSKMKGEPVKDEAGRTIKYVEYTLNVVGVVTLEENEDDTDSTVENLRTRLEAQGGRLSWTGRGFGSFDVNGPGGVQDVAWGPIPELFDFQPLGGGLGANVTWRVTTRIFEFQAQQEKAMKTNVKDLFVGQKTGPVLQFNYEVGISYDEANYGLINIRGDLEIPITRKQPNDNTVPDSVDNYRQNFMEQLIGGIDQTRWYITHRNFPISRDRRSMQFEVVAEEQPPMGDPPGASLARGRYTVRPLASRQGMVGGNVQWICSLSVTYTIRKDKQRRLAWLAFSYLLWYRMQFSRLGAIPPKAEYTVATFNPNNQPIVFPTLSPINNNPAVFYADPIAFYNQLFTSAQQRINSFIKSPAAGAVAWLVDFGLDEGLHRDSKTVTFEASWTLMCFFPNLLNCSGFQQLDTRSVGGNIWRLSMEDITTWRGSSFNAFDKSEDLIIDFGTK